MQKVASSSSPLFTYSKAQLITPTMPWNPFSSQKQDRFPSPKIEQRSHSPVGLAPADSDIARTLARISNDTPRVAYVHAQSDDDKRKTVSEFVAARPKNVFIIDGEKCSKESIICTADERDNKTCLCLKFGPVELFRQMQRLEYFCSLPNDIDATYFECRKIT